jgi:hypothetical protein
LSLAYFSSRRPTSSIMPTVAPPPVTQGTEQTPAESQAPAPVQSETAQPEASEPTPEAAVAEPTPEPNEQG